MFEISKAIGSQMAVRLSALRAGRSLLPRNIFLLLVLSKPKGPMRLEGLGKLKKKILSSVLEPAIIHLVA
jgi:hypothetical protein